MDETLEVIEGNIDSNTISKNEQTSLMLSKREREWMRLKRKQVFVIVLVSIFMLFKGPTGNASEVRGVTDATV